MEFSSHLLWNKRFFLEDRLHVFQVVATVSVCVLVLFTYWAKLEVVAVLVGVAALPLVFLLLRRAPWLPIAALLFVGSFKSTPIVGYDPTDPTFIAFALTVLAVVRQLLFSRTPLSQRFAGQGEPTLAFIAFLLMLAVSYVYSPAAIAGGLKLERFAVFDTLLFFAPLVVFDSERDIRRFLYIWLALGLALVVFTLYGVANPQFAGGEPNEVKVRLGAGALMGITALVVLYRRLNHRPKLLTVVCLPALVIGLLASGGRGPLLSFVGAIAVAMFIFRSRSALVDRRAVLIATVVAIIMSASTLVWIHQMPAAERRFGPKEAELVAMITGTSPGGTAGERIDMFRAALTAISEKPVLGMGIGGWSMYYENREDVILYPHNILLEVLAEQGLVGLTLFVFLLTAICRRLRHAARSDTFLFLVPVWIYCFLIGMPSGDIDNRVLWFWGGVVLASARFLRQTSSREVFTRTDVATESRRSYVPV